MQECKGEPLVFLILITTPLLLKWEVKLKSFPPPENKNSKIIRMQEAALYTGPPSLYFGSSSPGFLVGGIASPVWGCC